MTTALRLPLALLAALALPAGADHADKKAADVLVTPAGLEWADGPPSLPRGAKVAVLEGDPAKKGHFVMRAKLPDGYAIPPHTHPKDERVTVLSGTLYLGTGAKLDKKAAKGLPAGSYARTGAGMQHYGWAKGETVIQVHGEGPWDIVYVDPKDDPRKKK